MGEVTEALRVKRLEDRVDKLTETISMQNEGLVLMLKAMEKLKGITQYLVDKDKKEG